MRSFMTILPKGGVADKIRVCAGSQVIHLLILMSFSGPFHLASGGFLAAPPLISNCSNLPFGTQGRSWRLESCLQEMGDKKASMPGSPTGPPLGFKVSPADTGNANLHLSLEPPFTL